MRDLGWGVLWTIVGQMLAIGCMRLSTEAEVAADEARGVAVIHAALDAGVRLLDTADVYAPTPDAIGHNETLVAKALASWSGDASAVTVATKGGLTRPETGRWVPDGRASHLRAACEASLRRLGRERLDLYQLHAIDPTRKLSTSLRALAKLQREGLVDRVGLCNVTRGQLEQARDLLDVSTVQIELSPRCDGAIRGGVVERCRDVGIDVLAYRPLAGAKGIKGLRKDPALTAVASRHGVDPLDVALAWVRSLVDGLVTLPGPTTVEHAAACAEVLELSDEDRHTLDARFPAADVLRRPTAQRRPADDADGDVVLVVGMPGAGKSTHAIPLVEQGYARLNRDELGGRLSALVPKLEAHLQSGRRRVVLDNTYGSRAKRNEVVEAAWRHGVPVRCVHVDPTIERARVHAVTRMLDRHGRLLTPAEIRAASKAEPNTFGPRVQLEHQRALEPPESSEGFVSIDVIRPELEPPPKTGPRALILDLDRVGIMDAPTRAAIARDVAAGFSPIAFRWNPDRARDATHVTTIELDSPLPSLDVLTCPHPAGPPVCWCRPPMPGLLILALRTVGASPQRSRVVGGNAHAERYAMGAEIPYLDVEAWRAG